MNWFGQNNYFIVLILRLLFSILLVLVLYWDFYYKDDIYGFSYIYSLTLCTCLELYNLVFYFFGGLLSVTWLTDSLFYFIDILYIFFILSLVNTLFNGIISLNESLVSKFNDILLKLFVFLYVIYFSKRDV